MSLQYLNVEVFLISRKYISSNCGTYLTSTKLCEWITLNSPHTLDYRIFLYKYFLICISLTSTEIEHHYLLLFAEIFHVFMKKNPLYILCHKYSSHFVICILVFFVGHFILQKVICGERIGSLNLFALILRHILLWKFLSLWIFGVCILA